MQIAKPTMLPMLVFILVVAGCERKDTIVVNVPPEPQVNYSDTTHYKFILIDTASPAWIFWDCTQANADIICSDSGYWKSVSYRCFRDEASKDKLIEIICWKP